jgi:hypothetical protein
MGPTGAVYDTAECYMCHTGGSEANTSAFAHAAANTSPQFGESCEVCHGTGAQFSATQVHAGL